MRAFIINLDAAGDRWSAIETSFQEAGLIPVRVPAIDGAALQLPIESFSEKAFHQLHGRHTNLREVGCYLSHLRAIEAFLKTDDQHGLVCEDDVVPGASFAEVITRSLVFSEHWNVLRLCGLTEGTSLPVGPLNKDYKLCISVGRLKGAGAYLIDRTAGRAFLEHLRPMWLPFDHAFDREWFFGLRAACVLPFPCSQTEQRFRSSIQAGNLGKLPAQGRWLTTYPYQIANEITRWVFRLSSYAKARSSLLLRSKAKRLGQRHVVTTEVG